MNLNVKDILKCTNGKLIIGDNLAICKNYSIDSRTIKEGDTYVAIKGDSTDGNVFIENAFENGASVVIVSNTILSEEKLEKYEKMGKSIIQVEDTIIALGKMAGYKRNLYGNKLKVIGVTGSVGKTSTKDIIASVISQKYKTLKTEGNFNNSIGLPLTLLRLEDEEVAVVEMGMNHFEEISYLSKIARPDLAVITNIGTSHIGNLGSRENILKAKLEILDGMENKVLVINNDNDLLHKWNIETNKDVKTYTFGINNKSDFYAENVVVNENSSSFVACNEDNRFEVEVPVSGEHFILNSLCAFTVGSLLKLSNEEIKMRYKKF